MKYTWIPLVAILLLLGQAQPSHAQLFGKKKKKAQVAQQAPSQDKKKKSIEDITSKCTAYDGLFKLYQNKEDGTVYMLIEAPQLEKEYIYFSHVVDGAVPAGSFRGAFRGNAIFSVRRHFDRIEFINKNTSFYFDPKSPLSRAAHANISDAVLVSVKIEAADEKNERYLIKADEVFLAEHFNPIKPNYPPEYKGFKLGNLSKEKTKFVALKNYPANTDVIVEYVFDNSNPGERAEELADSRFVSIFFQHTLIEMPQNDFVPVLDDPRVGYFTTQVNDMTTTKAVNYRDLVHKWHLKKKNPNAELSEPVEPIVFWIENTTPYEFRDIIRQAGLRWNEAFEKAGFKNAIDIRVQPDTADWDAGDIRYNVLRWTSSPTPPFGGYGPSFVNPRTGQILGADIMLEFVFFTNRLRQQEAFDVAGISQWLQSKEEWLEKHPNACEASYYMHQAALFGVTALSLTGASEAEIKEYVENALYYLVLHEMGHTLGLNHNMKASQLHMPDEIHDKQLTQQVGLTASVMDYPAANLALDKAKQGQFFTTKPGPYDHWAIEFAYGNLEDPDAEAQRRQKLLERSTEHALMFGNDADDMRTPGRGIDPRVMIYDLSGDVVTYSMQRMELCRRLLGELLERYRQAHENESYQLLRNQYLIITTEMAYAANNLSRYVGGVYVERAFVGQKGATQPFKPVEREKQKQAMRNLERYVFAPDAFNAPSALYAHLQMQRRGFNFANNNEDPEIHTRVLNIQQTVLSHLLHPNTLTRIVNSELYGNAYPLSEMMTDLTNAIFMADLSGKVNTFRRNLQVEYVNRLLQVAGLHKGQPYPHVVREMAFYELQRIKELMKRNAGADLATKAHRNYLVFLIEKAERTD
ncbi:hypothetical protein FHS56_000432 [Thermonema lapsum]|uniref:DUF5117 domain-containing protein n=1 Tax=Thermonema lapsum TaxID=28195 RepID=A0A846MN24_9BACT|nr:zinc-dependent metalloprotease [Thermonema lapsum]NIK72946.1 hypothetical protein [Thermonema lapsum]